MNIKILYSVIILLESIAFLLIGCDNWKESPTQGVLKTDSIQVVETISWQKINVPSNVSYFFPYSNNLILIGTETGEIFYSTDNGIGWNTSNINMENPGMVRAIIHKFVVNPYYPNGSIFGSFYTCAVTDSAIFRSINEGRTWTMDVKFTSNQLPVIVNSISDDKSYSYVTVFVSGKFGNINVYFTKNSFKSGIWQTLKMDSGIIKLFEYPFIYATDSLNKYLAIYENQYLRNRYYLNSNNNVNDLAVNSKGVAFTGTNEGLLASSNSGVSWSVVSLKGDKIKNLEISQNDIIFIYKTDGLFCSTDNGINWVDITPPFISSLKDMRISSDGYLYIYTENKEYYYIRIASQKLVLTPILLYPVNNSVIDTSSFELNWYDWKDLQCGYNLQISEDSNFTNKILVHERWLGTNSYSASKLGRNKKYYWRVSAINSISQSPWTKSFAFLVK